MLNMRDRLKHIRNIKNEIKNQKKKNENEKEINLQGWEKCGRMVLKRNIFYNVSFKIKNDLPFALEVLVPDLTGRLPQGLDKFLFFDLETTGLSGGAGTLAFLAAFGRLAEEEKLKITQYLLLDYPGEGDFLDAAIKEITPEKAAIVTYNGKCFDSQVVKTRCLMNGIALPAYHHIDLLHPARRLWKNIIQDCSQASVETKILGLDRTGDIPGFEAPDIWFDFLKTGRTDRLQGICDHNAKDIIGLAAMLNAVITIARDPVGQKKYNYDKQRLAFFLRFFLCRGKKYLQPQYNDMLKTCVELLNYTIKSNCPEKIKDEAERFLRIYKNKWIRDINTVCGVLG